VYYLLASGSLGGFPVSRGARDPIRIDEIARTFSDAAVAKLADRVGMPVGTDLKELATGIRASVEQYAKEVRLATPNTVHREIDALERAARGRADPKLRRIYADLSDNARQLLEDRSQRIRDRAQTTDEIRRWVLPDPADLSDPYRQLAASETIHRVAVTGAYWSKGRRRPGGKNSVQSNWQLHAPELSKSEPRREAERTFVRWLQVAYRGATGCMPPNTAQHDRPGPFARMVAECLRLARAPSSDPDDDRTGLAVQLINDLDRERRRDGDIRNWRRILRPLRLKYAVVDDIAGLVEQGQVDVKSMLPGMDEDPDAFFCPPALIEFKETGTICFYLLHLRQTIRIKPFPRARIMEIANRLRSMATRERGARRTGPQAAQGLTVRFVGAEG
jgi:hypothetical protein